MHGLPEIQTRGLAQLAAAVLTAGGLACAAPAQEIVTREVPVELGDLDLARPADAATALDRIERAASQACGKAPSRGLQQRWNYRVCVHDATADALADLDAPLVTALSEEGASRAFRSVSASP